MVLKANIMNENWLALVEYTNRDARLLRCAKYLFESGNAALQKLLDVGRDLLLPT